MDAKEREAHNRRVRKYQKSLGQISIRLKQEELDKYKAAAERAGMTFRAWVLAALDEAIKRRL